MVNVFKFFMNWFMKVLWHSWHSSCKVGRALAKRAAVKGKSRGNTNCTTTYMQHTLNYCAQVCKALWSFVRVSLLVFWEIIFNSDYIGKRNPFCTWLLIRWHLRDTHLLFMLFQNCFERASCDFVLFFIFIYFFVFCLFYF